MKSILLNLDSSSDKNLYEQVYEALKNDIVSGKLGKGTKLTALGENGGFLLKHSVGSLPGGTEVDVPVSYADYYFLEALLKLSR